MKSDDIEALLDSIEARITRDKEENPTYALEHYNAQKVRSARKAVLESLLALFTEEKENAGCEMRAERHIAADMNDYRFEAMVNTLAWHYHDAHYTGAPKAPYERYRGARTDEHFVELFAFEDVRTMIEAVSEALIIPEPDPAVHRHPPSRRVGRSPVGTGSTPSR